MATEQLTYAELAQRLGVSLEAARAVARRLQFPKGRTNDGKTLLTVDLEAIQHRPLTKSPTKQQATVAALKQQIADLQNKIVELQVAVNTARSDVLRERDRSERLIADMVQAKEQAARLQGALDALQGRSWWQRLRGR